MPASVATTEPSMVHGSQSAAHTQRRARSGRTRVASARAGAARAVEWLRPALRVCAAGVKSQISFDRDVEAAP